MRNLILFFGFILPGIASSQTDGTAKIDSVNTYRICIANYHVNDSASIEEIAKWEKLAGQKIYIERYPTYYEGKLTSVDVSYYFGIFLNRAEAEKYSRVLKSKGFKLTDVTDFYKGRRAEIICRIPLKD